MSLIGAIQVTNGCGSFVTGTRISQTISMRNEDERSYVLLLEVILAHTYEQRVSDADVGVTGGVIVGQTPSYALVEFVLPSLFVTALDPTGHIVRLAARCTGSNFRSSPCAVPRSSIFLLCRWDYVAGTCCCSTCCRAGFDHER